MPRKCRVKKEPYTFHAYPELLQWVRVEAALSGRRMNDVVEAALLHYRMYLKEKPPMLAGKGE